MSDSTTPEVETPEIRATVEDAGTCRKKLHITVPPELVREEMDRAFLEIIRSVHVPGFRVGHLPRKVAEMRFGKAIRSEVRGNLLEKAFQQVLDRERLTPLGAPDLEGGDGEIDPTKELSFDVTVEVRPQVVIPDLKDIRIARLPVKVEPADIDRAVDRARSQAAELRPAEDGTVGEGDLVVLDAAIVMEGERVLDVENIQYRHPSEVVAGIPVKGVAAAILGKKGGEEVGLEVELPSNFTLREHAGKAAKLQLIVRDVKRFHLPEVDEAFAKSLDFESVEDLREAAARAVARELAQAEEKRLDAAILDAVLAKAPIELPEGIVKKEIGQVLSRYQADMHMQGASEEAIEEKLAEVQGDAAEHVAREFRVAFLVDEYARVRNIFVTENEVNEQVLQMASRYGRSPEDMRAHLETRQLFPSLRGRLRERRVLESLRSEVTIEG